MAKLNYKIKEKNQNSAEISINGEFILSTFLQQKEKFEKDTKKYKSIVIKPENISETDLSCIQYLIAYKKNFEKENGVMKVEKFNEKLDILLKRNGFIF